MTKYEEMCLAAETARKNFLDYQSRCWGYFFTILKGLEEHCGIPDDQIVYLKSNGCDAPKRRYEPADPGQSYTVPGAVVFDESDGTFHLGLLIYLTPANHFPRQHVSFALRVHEVNGSPSVRIGIDAKPRVVALNDEAARNAFCEEIAKEAIEAFAHAPNRPSSPMGFTLSPLSEPTS